MAGAPTVTREFRRYALRAELFDEFLAWYLGGVPAHRARFGFTVELCIVDRERLEFDWLVAHRGTPEEFRDAVAAHKADPDWVAYHARMPAAIERIEKSFVEVVAPG